VPSATISTRNRILFFLFTQHFFFNTHFAHRLL
jgi:hypothetical protein